MTSCAGSIFGLAIETGEPIWSYDVTTDGAARSFTGRVLWRDRTVFVAPHGEGAHIYALDASTGAVRWKHAAGTGVATDLVGDDASLYAVTLEDELLCLDLDTGDLRWSVAASHIPAEARTLGSTPAVTDGRVFFAALNGSIQALATRDGSLLWKRKLGHEVTTAVLRDGGALVVGLADSTVVRIDAVTGEMRGVRRLPSHPGGALARHGELLVLMLAPSSSSSIVAVMDPTGQLLWQAEAPRGYWTTPRPTLFDGRVWLGTSEGTVHAFHVQSGTLLASIAIDPEHDWGLDNVRVLGVDAGGLYVGTIGGVLYAFDRRP